MARQLELSAAAAALLITLITGVIAVETRYARSADVRQQMDSLYARTLKLRILELQLKPAPLSAADRAMLLHLEQELKEATD